MLKLREKLLVEKCLNSIIRDYQKREDVNALIDLKLDFLSFLTSNLQEEVVYGLEYIKLKYPDIHVLLGSMILEYTTNGLNGSLECKPIPGIEEPEIVEIRYTLLDRIKDWIKSFFPEEEPKGTVIWEKENIEHLQERLKGR